MSGGRDMFEPRLAARKRWARLWSVLFAALSVVGLVFLVVLLFRVFSVGWQYVSIDFLRNKPSRLDPESSGVYQAVLGSLWVIGLTGMIATPVGVAAAIYLEEFAANNRLTRFIHVNIANLAGVPSVVYGMLGLAMFVRLFKLERSVISGALTLSLLVVPVVIIASREALVAVPSSIRHAAFAMGATRWQTVRSHVLPSAIPGIMTGVILAVSRAIGEAAPLLVVGAATYITFAPESLKDPFTVLPLQIYQWTDEPQQVFHKLAATGIIVLLGILIPMNAIAIGIRALHERRKAW